MSVLKNKRKESSAEFINCAYNIYIQTIEFASKLSSRYSRIMAENITSVAFDVMHNAESANAVYPSNPNRYELREKYLLAAKGSLRTLDVALSVCYDVLMKNPQGAFQVASKKPVAPAAAIDKLDKMAQSLGELIDLEEKMIAKIIKNDHERCKKEAKEAAKKSTDE